MTRVASLGMYDAPWLHAENDRLWLAVRQALGMADAPAALDRSRPLGDILRDPALLLGQTCGYPLTTILRGAVRLVATPVYDLPGCHGPRHCSFLVVRADDPARQLADLRGRTAAINGLDSNSGMNLLRAAVAPLARGGRFFGGTRITGSHLSGLATVRRGETDIVAIDCVTYGLTQRCRPNLLEGTRVLASTASSPALPLVTAARTPDAVVVSMRRALQDCLPWPGLGLASLAILDLAEYDVVQDLERRAGELGYLVLA